MEKTVTYSLLNNNTESDFYFDLRKFTDVILQHVDLHDNIYIADYYAFIEKTKLEPLHALNEYVLEFVMIGVFWQNYSGNSSRTGRNTSRFLQFLYRQRKRFPSLKAKIDVLRGFFSYILLEKNKLSSVEKFDLENFQRLLNWLQATGEFNEEVIRLKLWEKYLQAQHVDYVCDMLHAAVQFADVFSTKGKEQLSRYVDQVSVFQSNNLAGYKYKEDYFLAGRRENEYYLNMFGAEILNRELRADFEATNHKALLLPTCMRTESLSGCKAKSDGKELVCVSCNAACRVGQVANEMKMKNVTTYLIPHSSDFSRFLSKWKDNKDTSLIGVACVLNLLTGGYEMKRLNIASQCVFLDYCGCKKHWDKKGFATSLNMKELQRIIS